MRTPVFALRTSTALLAGLVLVFTAHAESAGANGLPTTAEALAAYHSFSEDPPRRLDRTQPFLDFIRSSGEVHVVLNDGLLAWMYGELAPAHKAVLYAAFLGGNMAAQLERGEAGSDNAAAMRATLAAYRALKADDPALNVPLLESLLSAESNGQLVEQVARIVAGD